MNDDTLRAVAPQAAPDKPGAPPPSAARAWALVQLLARLEAERDRIDHQKERKL